MTCLSSVAVMELVPVVMPSCAKLDWKSPVPMSVGRPLGAGVPGVLIGPAKVGVSDTASVGEAVSVGVGVRVSVLVAVGVGVGVWVSVAVAVAVLVGVLVGAR